MGRTGRGLAAIGIRMFLWLGPGIFGHLTCRAQQPAAPAGHTYFYTMREVLKELEDRKYELLNNNILDLSIVVQLTARLKDLPVKQLLEQSFSGLKYTHVVISRGISFGNPGGAGSSPYKDLVGRVTDTTGKPLAGVTVAGAGSTVRTDDAGWFTLDVHSVSVVVQLSCVGYAPDKKVLLNTDTQRIVLSPAPTDLDKAMVVAFGTTTQRLKTENTFVVRNSDIVFNPTGNLLDDLSAKAPGLYDRMSSGVPGAAHVTTLEGIHSLFAGTSISYVLDGVPLVSDGFINPIGTGSAQGTGGASLLNFIPRDFIESISLLKDAAAKAVYGSWAANGVILITLKPGKADSILHWVADFNLGIGRAGKTSRQLSTLEFLQLRQEALNNDLLPVNTVPELQWGNTRQTDYQQLATGGTARISNANLLLNGGSQTLFFLAAGNLHRETTVFPGNTSYERQSLYVNVHAEPQDKPFKAAVSALYTFEKSHLPVYDYTGYERLAPNAPSFYNSAGQLQWGQQPLSYLNIPAQENNAYVGNIYTLFLHVTFCYRINKSLSLEQHLGYNGILTQERSVLPLSGQDPDPLSLPTGSLTLAENRYSSTFVETLGRWESGLKKGKLKGVAGIDWQTKTLSYSSLLESGYTDDVQLNAGIAAPQTTPTGNEVYYRYAAVFAKLDYVLHNRYLVTASWRCDGSSRFGPGNRFGNFWAIAPGYIFRANASKSGLSYGKIRGSLGTTGNDQVGDGQYVELYGAGLPSASHPQQQGIVPMTLANPNLRWELNYRGEVGVELGFLKDRILVNLTAYSNWSRNQVVNAAVAPVAGLSQVWINWPVKVVNEALEWVVSANILSTEHWGWKSQLTLTLPRNELARWPGLDSSQSANTFVVGKSLTVTKGYHSTGVDPQKGIYTFRTSNPSGIPDLKDEVPDAGMDPRWYAGWSNQLRFGPIGLDLFLDMRGQNAPNPLIVLARQNPPGRQAPSQLSNGPVEWLDHWRRPGDHVAQQQPTVTPGTPADQALAIYMQSDAYSTHASYIRLKSVSLTYSVADGLLKKLGVHGCKIYVSGQNLWTRSHFPVTDPETQNPLALPPLRMIAAGMHISF